MLAPHATCNETNRSRELEIAEKTHATNLPGRAAPGEKRDLQPFPADLRFVVRGGVVYDNVLYAREGGGRVPAPEAGSNHSR
jgi:hypothetical protein